MMSRWTGQYLELARVGAWQTEQGMRVPGLGLVWPGI